MDQRFFAAPHGFSQLSTSFFAIACLGIHRTPLLTFPCMACTITVRHAGYELDFFYLAFYLFMSAQALRGPRDFTTNMSKNIPPAAGLSRLRGVDPQPGPHTLCVPAVRLVLSLKNMITHPLCLHYEALAQ